MSIQDLLQTETQFLHSILNSIGNAIIITNIDGIIEIINRQAEEITGWSQQDAIGKPIKDVLPLINWTSDELYNEDIKKVKELGILKFNENSLLVDRNGKDQVISGTAAPILNDSSQIIGIALCFQDITERYKKEEIVKMQKFESLGILAGGIAHDFNNILTAILGNVSLARIDSDPKDVLERLTDTEKALNRAKYLTQQLLNFSRDGLPIKEITSISDLIKDSAKFMLSGSNVRCEFDIPDDLWMIEADENQINQVITNIVINAVQAMPKGGIINISAQNVSLKDGEVPLLNQGNYIKISIQDHGIGISKDNLQRIFDPYFTTKRDGTGLGLTVSFYIIRNHNGQILVDSELGVGTTFYIYLPASPEKKIDKKKESDNLISDGKGKILVLDDDNTIRELISTMLGSFGYDVTTVADGTEVIKEYKEALEGDSPFDVVIMDLTIPGGMGAKETIDILKELDPKVKAIVSSGYSNDHIVNEYERYGFKGAITKPYGIKELCSVINNTIIMSD
ncbi:MAG: hybrid sensor histidine kinase/response regulator [Candidatus Poribacteria bacterium]